MLNAQRFCGAVVIFAMSVACALDAVAQGRAVPTMPELTPVQPDVAFPLDRPMQRPAGIAWQPPEPGGRPRLWITDWAGSVVAVNLQTRRSIEYDVTERVSPGPAAFDFRRRNLWAIHRDRSQQQLIRGFRNPGSGPTGPNPELQPLARADLPVLSNRPRITGMAVDSSRDTSTIGDIVWVCRGGGLCSTIEVYDVRRREMLAQFFPRCEPKDIAIDPDGRRLWILADNGPARSMVLVERWLTSAFDNPRPTADALRTRRYLVLPPETPRATAIAATGSAVWALLNDPSSSANSPTSGAPP